MKKLLIVFVLANFIHHVYGQNMSGKEARALKGKILLVGLDEVSKADLDGVIKAKGDTAKFNYLVGKNAEALKNAVEKYWTFTKYQIMPKGEAVELLRKEPEKYALLALARYVDYYHYGGEGSSSSKAKFSGPDGMLYSNSMNSPTYWVSTNETMELRLFNPKRAISIGLPRIILTEADAISAVKQFQYYCTSLDKDEKSSFYSLAKKCNGNGLKNIPLLLNKVDVEEKLTDEEIKKTYTSNFKLVTQTEIDSAIIHEANCAIVQIISAEGGKGNVSQQFIVNAGSGELYGIIYPGVAFQIKGTDWIKYNQRIKKKNLKEMEEISNCK